MNELDIQIQNLEKRLKQKKEAKRKAEAKDRAKEQRELDRRNLLLGRALTESCNAVHFAKFRGYISSRKNELTNLSEKDFEMLLGYFEALIASKPSPKQSPLPLQESA
jgi:hypothetical protein